MFKKFKDKLAEEVKSSPQRIQQFAQAAQAAVTSASSSISDITNNDLFSIGGDDTPTQSSPARPLGALGSRRNDSALNSSDASSSYTAYADGETTPTNDEQNETDYFSSISGSASQRLRKLSTGSAASDVSFRLPSYETPNMYHLQSDMEMSEAESLPGSVSLERVAKDQLYAAYRRTQERYNKYRTRYADLAKHYKSLEKENAKARAVLVETQDKALRRISELREQCALEQSAKAHLESALRVELDEKNFKIESLNTKIKLLQNNSAADSQTENSIEPKNEKIVKSDSEIKPESVQNLIDLSPPVPSVDDSEKTADSSVSSSEIALLNNKIQKMEQLAAKYKESLKSLKEKNSQLTTEIQIVSNELDKKVKENDQLQAGVKQLTEARQQILNLKEQNTELNTKLENFDKMKDREVSAVEIKLCKAMEDIKNLNAQIEVFTKREEENAISLAENKLSIHKELESKESEIKLLTEDLKSAKNEVKSYELIVEELKQSLKKTEEEKSKFNSKLSEMKNVEIVITQLKQNIDELQQLNNSLDQKNSKLTENFKLMELQMKQEESEKLAMVDRNNYLETRNQQLMEDNSKKNKQITDLEKEFMQNNNSNENNEETINILCKEKDEALEQKKVWQEKYTTLELEIKEERIELGKLQSEIEKMLHNYEKLQLENIELSQSVTELKSELQLKNDQTLKMENKLRGENSEIQNKLNGIQIELAAATENYAKREKELKQKTKEKQDQFDSKLKSLTDDYESKISELTMHKDSSETNKNIEEIKELNNKIKDLQTENNELKDNVQHNSELITENEKLKHEIQELNCKNSDIDNLKLELDNKLSEKSKLELQIKNLQQENESLRSKSDKILEDLNNLQFQLSEVKMSHELIEKEKDELKLKITDMEQDAAKNTEKEYNLHNETLAKNEEIKKNVDKLKQELESIMSEKHKLHNQLLEAQYDLKEKDKEVSKFKEDSNIWEQKLASILNENNIIHEKYEKLKQEKENLSETLSKLENKLSDSEKKFKQQEEATIEKEFLNLRTSQLENDLKFATLEKDKLVHENQQLQEEISELRKEQSSEIQELKEKIQKEISENEQLKGKLENNIEQLNEEKFKNNEKSEHILKLQDSISDLNLKFSDNTKEIELLKQSATLYSKEREIWEAEKNGLNVNIQDLEKIENEFVTLKQDYEKLKEDKCRLTADIEGLQNHLTKVSKDNSQLNERLREMIANDESSLAENNDTNNSKWVTEINKLKDDLKIRLDQIEDLERQNSILVEEKLELEDQLKSQNGVDNNNSVRESTEKDLEITRLKEKNNNLITEKSQLESKLADLEIMGRSRDSSISHMEQKNEKLRLTNEKLERRLDEALVSLRHMRSLEENTELEYLRNILYEYLTGSGAHSITLAKVLAAVVKFDDRQTQLVLQREKERQGLLGQLGIL